MDDKASRQHRFKKQERRSVDSKRFVRKAYKTIQAHRRAFLTGLLCVAFIVLLFGIVAQLPVPIENNAPANVKTVDYTTFVKQIQAGHVEAVVIQGNTVNGLLVTSLKSKDISGNQQVLSEKEILASSDYARWLHLIGLDSASSSSNASTKPFDANRAVFAQIPSGDHASLVHALTDKHVLVSSCSSC